MLDYTMIVISQVFIGYTGTVSLTNGQFEWDSVNAPDGELLQRSVSTALPQHTCYAFSIEDANTRVTLHVRAVPCRGEAPVAAGVLATTTISLRTPRRATQRHVLVKKLGEPLIDVWVDGLEHGAGVRVVSTCALLIILSLLLSTAQHL